MFLSNNDYLPLLVNVYKTGRHLYKVIFLLYIQNKKNYNYSETIIPAFAFECCTDEKDNCMIKYAINHLVCTKKVMA
jgi:hypothetical protein